VAMRASRSRAERERRASLGKQLQSALHQPRFAQQQSCNRHGKSRVAGAITAAGDARVETVSALARASSPFPPAHDAKPQQVASSVKSAQAARRTVDVLDGNARIGAAMFDAAEHAVKHRAPTSRARRTISHAYFFRAQRRVEAESARDT
jgi:hypothetical protein